MGEGENDGISIFIAIEKHFFRARINKISKHKLLPFIPFLLHRPAPNCSDKD